MQHPPPRRHTPSVEDQTAAEPNQKDMTKSSYIQVLTSQISLTLLQAFRNLSRCAGGLRAISVLSGFFRVSLTSASLSEDLPSCSVYPSKLFFAVVLLWWIIEWQGFVTDHIKPRKFVRLCFPEEIAIVAIPFSTFSKQTNVSLAELQRHVNNKKDYGA